MQANNDPKWPDDDAFWSEAWADMDKRLDQGPPPSRKSVVIRWRQYGWLLGLILLVTAVATPAAVAYFSQDGKIEQKPASPKVPAIPVAVPPVVIASNGREPSSQEAMVSDRTSDKTSTTNSSSIAATAVVVPKNATSPVAASAPTSASMGATSSASLTDNGAIDLDETPTASPSLANIIPNTLGASGQNTPPHIPSAKEIPEALTALTGQPIRPVKLAQNLATGQLDVNIGKPKMSPRFYLDAGTSYGFQDNKVGYYAGLQYSLPITGRFSIPIGFRFRRDFHQFVELAESGTPVRLLEISNTTAAAAPDTILFEFTAGNLKEIVTTGFEGRIGLAYSVTPRLRIGASLSLNYLQTAVARISSQYQAEFSADQNRFLNASADIALANDLNFSRTGAAFAVFNTPITERAGFTSNFPKFNQWLAYTGASVSYDLTQKLSLSLSGRRLLAQPDQSSVIGLQRGQLEIGARWRLK